MNIGKRKFNKGFTLVELLVVMGILAILMAAVVVGIDPLDKLNSAGDAKAQEDVGTIARAMEAYSAGHGGTYPCYTSGTLSSYEFTMSGELKTVPAAPTGRSYDYSLCTTSAGMVGSKVLSKKFLSDSKSPFYIANTGTVYWIWCSTSGRAYQVANSIACP